VLTRLFSHEAPFSANLPLVRDEIIQNWLLAEAKSPTTTTRNAQYCSFTYNDGVRFYQNSNAKWHWLDRELSSNVAGETGAVYIYKGALAAMNLVPNTGSNTDALDFCQEHMQNEAAHLQLFEAVVHDSKCTVLLPVWRMAGWVLGFVPTLIGGSKGLYVTVEAVETFVEEHYREQIVPLKQEGISTELVRLLEYCCEDEVHHKEDAAQKLLGPEQKEFHAWWAKPWAVVVRTGSRIAAEVARRI
jgi:ubiquinone biosynthesis monooxygenase Coq7